MGIKNLHKYYPKCSSDHVEKNFDNYAKKVASFEKDSPEVQKIYESIFLKKNPFPKIVLVDTKKAGMTTLPKNFSQESGEGCSKLKKTLKFKQTGKIHFFPKKKQFHSFQMKKFWKHAILF